MGVQPRLKWASGDQRGRPLGQTKGGMTAKLPAVTNAEWLRANRGYELGWCPCIALSWLANLPAKLFPKTKKGLRDFSLSP